ncbi:type III secretion system export apparatus subunit SctR [Herbaspirillum huttiense F1]|uniref:Type III secretion system export apparatus subunit SctR n=3 Tax=Herbaspirillum huttiense TaxID=863372 RepID=A0AAJ2HEF3_9BURK|nr:MULTISPECIES: type III secretion system export apparatus subunit SctR [Herbaspirillum]MBP1313307.1 type III secretion protein R [Herbaspirillum sp. 1130]MDR6738549.1 type III secretion protein R [Herbaspirillum sp. 1173]MDR9838871.1 type III secretion system export apparatus subunit SctR [Herbaspirillum huttiense]MDR9851317.1 type III secretion system export apparatus subunit SctR [Herbaspirillum huttiense SE1]MDT0358230.1 type III secretion system export apparatus subunit SctR [Herbaspiril
MLNNQFDVVSFSVLLALLALIPLLVVTTTSFLKISLVLLVLRNAIGVQQVPPTLAIYGISLALSVFIMAPTVQEIGVHALQMESSPVTSRTTPLLVRAQESFEPLRKFMMKVSRPEQRELFLASAKKLWPKDVAKEARPSDALILIPAFVVSELQAGYEIGFLIYIPFVIIDLLISNLLMALGMQQVSPQTITIPLKLLLFTLVAGWGKLLNALALSYV